MRQQENNSTIIILFAVTVLVAGALSLFASLIDSPTVVEEKKVLQVIPEQISIVQGSCSGFTITNNYGVDIEFLEIVTSDPNIIIDPILPLMEGQTKNINVCISNISEDQQIIFKANEQESILKLKVK